MLNLVVDIGNSNTKVAVFIDGSLKEFQRYEAFTPAQLQEWLDRHTIDNAALSSVADEGAGLKELLGKKTNFVPFSTDEATGITNNYGSPETLGLDRWAKLIAAFHLYKGSNCLIIDAGTCITYDLLSGEGIYNGGSISPGIGMRFRALNNYTERLPLINWDGDLSIPQGNNTKNAVTRGVLNGTVMEVTGIVAEYDNEWSELQVLITGGDAEFLLPPLKNRIFAPRIIKDPFLVLKGLNEVIRLKTCT